MFVFVNFSRILAKLTISRFIIHKILCIFMLFFIFPGFLKIPQLETCLFLVIFYIFFSYFYHFCEFVDTDAGSQGEI